MLFQRIEGANLRLIGDPDNHIIDIHARRETSQRRQTGVFTQLGNSFNPIYVGVKP